jgi:3-oxoacyl-[acyl-carrier protein] reductase
MRFAGKHILITGAARGIGFEIARQFGNEGGRLSLIDNHRENLSETAEQFRKMGFTVHDYCIDVADRNAVERAVDEAEKVQPIDVLINNAGIARETPFVDISEEEWRQIIDVNLTGMFFMSQAVCRRMLPRRRGAIVNMSSKNGLDGESGYAHYNASKGGVIMLTKTMALELASSGIRVNAVCPGYIETPLSKSIDSPEFTNAFINRYIPMNRAGSVEDVAPAFLFLASDESSFITGQVIIIDGGQLAGQKPMR